MVRISIHDRRRIYSVVVSIFISFNLLIALSPRAYMHILMMPSPNHSLTKCGIVKAGNPCDGGKWLEPCHLILIRVAFEGMSSRRIIDTVREPETMYHGPRFLQANGIKDVNTKHIFHFPPMRALPLDRYLLRTIISWKFPLHHASPHDVEFQSVESLLSTPG